MIQLQTMLDVADNTIEVEYPGLKHLLSAECEELSGHGCRASGREIDLGDFFRVVSSEIAAGQDEFAASRNNCQEIVEVVSDSAG